MRQIKAGCIFHIKGIIAKLFSGGMVCFFYFCWHFFCLFKSTFLCHWQLNHTTTLCRKRYEMQKDPRNVLEKNCKVHNISQTWTSVTSPCPCFFLLLYLATQMHAKTNPKRLIAEDKANKALIFLFTKRRESRKSRERQEEKTPYELWLPPIFSIKIYVTYSIELFLLKLRAFENLHLKLVPYLSRCLLNSARMSDSQISYKRAQFSFSRAVQTHPIRVYTIDLAKLLEHPLRSPDKRRRAFKLLHLRNRSLSWFLVRHWTYKIKKHITEMSLMFQECAV